MAISAAPRRGLRCAVLLSAGVSPHGLELRLAGAGGGCRGLSALDWAFVASACVAGHGDTGERIGGACTPWQRYAWIAARTVAAIITVPIAEELAFRGYLARRIMAADVEAIPFSRVSVIAILISSAAFGVMHGSLWLAGIIAGVVFALVARMRNRLGEAVAAHAVANLCIAVWVLVRHDYSLW